MRNGIKEKVLEFCKNVNTEYLNSNQFVAEYFVYYNIRCGGFNYYNFIHGDSIESILRARRKLVEEGKIERNDISRDSEKEYIKEFRK